MLDEWIDTGPKSASTMLCCRLPDLSRKAFSWCPIFLALAYIRCPGEWHCWWPPHTVVTCPHLAAECCHWDILLPNNNLSSHEFESYLLWNVTHKDPSSEEKPCKIPNPTSCRLWTCPLWSEVWAVACLQPYSLHLTLSATMPQLPLVSNRRQDSWLHYM